MASTVLAWQPGDGPAQPRKLSSWFPLLQDDQRRVEKEGSARRVRIVLLWMRPAFGIAALLHDGAGRKSRGLYGWEWWLMTQGHQLPSLPNRSLVAQDLRISRIFQNLINRTGFTIKQDSAADQPDSVAIVCIVRPMDRGERLDRIARGAMPPVDGDPSLGSGQPIRKHNIFLMAGNQDIQRTARGLAFFLDLLIMLPIVGR